MEPEKLKEVDQEQLEIILKNQVKKIIENLEEKANIIAHDNFKQHNGERAVQTKKSLEKLIATVQADPNPRNQLKMLVAYKQKKSWWDRKNLKSYFCNFKVLLILSYEPNRTVFQQLNQ